MKIKLKEPLLFILKKDLLEFDIEPATVGYTLTAVGFKQKIKQSEYDAIMATQKTKTAPIKTTTKRQTLPESDFI